MMARVWSWVVLISVLGLFAVFALASWNEVIRDYALAWYCEHDEFAAEKPWYVVAYERRLARRKGAGG